MNWIKNSRQRMEGLSQAIIRYPLTISFLGLSVLFTLITIQTDGQSDYYIEVLACIVGALSTATAQALYERFFRKNQMSRWIIYIGTVLFSVAYYVYLGQSGIGYNEAASIRTGVLLFSLFITFIWLPSIRHTLTFSNSFVANFKAFFVTLLLSVVLVLGMYSVLGTFDFLIMDISFRLYSYIASFIFQLFAPIYFLSLIPVYSLPLNSEQKVVHLDKKVTEAISVPRILEIILSYIVIPLIVAFTLILLLYIVSNITGEFWNDNALEPMLVSYAVTGWITLFLTESVNNKSTVLFQKFFPKLLLIVVSFQTVASILRIQSFGITHGRYYVILFGVFSILSSILYSFLKTNKNIVPGLLILFSLVSIIPPIDAMTVSLNNQINRLEQLLEENDMLENNTLSADGTIPETQKQQIAASLGYIDRRNALNELAWLPDDFELYGDFETTFGFSRTTYEESEWDEDEISPDYFQVSSENEQAFALDVSDVDSVVSFYMSQDSLNENMENHASFTIDNNNYTLEWSETNNEISLGLSEEMTGSILTFDLTFLLEEFEYSFDPYILPVNQLSFTEETDDVILTLVIEHLQVYEEGYFDGEFFALITLK